MAISLEKGQRIEIGLSKVSVGLGWDPNEGTGFDFGLNLRSATYDLGQATQPLNPVASSIKSTRMASQPQ